MVTFDEMVKKAQQQQQKDEEEKKNLFKIQNEGTTSNQSLGARLLGVKNDETHINNTANIKKSLEGVDRNKYGFIGDFVDTWKGFVGDLGKLAQYGWTKLTNKNSARGINDYKKFTEYQSLMNAATSEDEYYTYQQKMIDEGIIDEKKYNEHINEEKSGKYYEFEQAKEKGKNAFNTRIDDAISPIIKQVSDRYQINVIGEGIDSLKSQYSMAYENAMNAYNDTRDERILKEWDSISNKYQKDIIDIAKSWATKITQGKKYGEAYNETLSSYINKEKANELVDLERQMSDATFKYTLERNFNDAGDYLSTGNLFQTFNSGLLGVKNTLVFLLKKIAGDTIEEGKQAITGRYDVVEELANVYEFEDNAGPVKKILGSGKWVANRFLDSLPQIGPVAAEIYLTRKLPGGMMKKIDALADTTFKNSNLMRMGSRRISRFLAEITMDNLVYDTSFQVLMGHPITGEEENINVLFNGIIDGAQAMLQTPAQYLNKTLTKANFLDDVLISQEALNIAKKTTKENKHLMVEQLVLLRGMEIEEGTKANKALKSKSYTMKELEEASPELAAKYKKLQEEAAAYTERIKNLEGNADDYILTLRDAKSRKQVNDMTLEEQYSQGAELVANQSKVVRDLKDRMIIAAKVVGNTIKGMIEDGRVSKEEIRLYVNQLTRIQGMDDIVLGLATGNLGLKNQGLAKVAESGEKLTADQINDIYNGLMVKIADTRGDILKADEWLGGLYKKNDKGEYIAMFGEPGEKATFDEITKMYKEQIGQRGNKVIGEDRIAFEIGFGNAFRNYRAGKAAKQLDETSEIDLSNTMFGIKGLGLDNWANKTEGEKNFITKLFSSNGIKIATDENGNIIGITTVGAIMDDIALRINNFGKNGIDLFDEADLATYRLLFSGDILSSYKRYFNKLKESRDAEIKKAQAAGKKIDLKQYTEEDFEKNFETWFEKLFTEEGKRRLKEEFNKKEIIDLFLNMFANNATFPEIEQEAATLLIKNIMEEAVDLGEEDAGLYKKIKDTLLKGHYFSANEIDAKEAIPVVNLIFNNIQYLKGLGVKGDYTEYLSKKFAELIVDDKTLKTLSTLDNNYLYQGIIAKLLLEGKEGEMYYKSSLMRMLSQLPTNLPDESKDAVGVLNQLVKTIDGFDKAEISGADKQVLLTKVLGAIEGVKEIKLGKVEFKKGSGVIKKGDTYIISDVTKLTDDDIDKLAEVISKKIFINNNLPDCGLLKYYQDIMKENLRNLNFGGRLEFSLAQGLGEKEGIINLTLLGDAQLMQLLMHPDNMLSALISKKVLSNDLKDIPALMKRLSIFREVGLAESYQKSLENIAGVLQLGDELSSQELANEVLKLVKENGLLDKGAVLSKIEDIYDKIVWNSEKTLFDRMNAQKEMDALISNIKKLINIVNVPGLSKTSDVEVQRLYETQCLLERGKQLMLGNVKNRAELEKELNNTALGVEAIRRPSDIFYNGLHTNSKVINGEWDKGTNKIFYDSPVNFDWGRGEFQGKRIVILDTETTDLIKRDKKGKIISTPDVWYISYRVLENGQRRHVKKFFKSKKKISEFTKELMDRDNGRLAKKYNEASETFAGSDEVEKLNELLADKNTYLVGHNIAFDADTLKAAGVKINGDRLIDTNIISQAFLPVTKNHKQDTLIEAFSAINNPMKKIKADYEAEMKARGELGADETLGDHHDAEIDTLELTGILPFLINHADKNGKVNKKMGMLNYLADLSRRGLDENIITANALPFYKLETNWSNSMGGRMIDGERVFDMPTLLKQFFGTNPTREEIAKEAKYLNEHFTKNETLNIHDVVDLIADKLGDERSLYILNKLKEFVDSDAVIDVNKVLIGDETINAFLNAQRVMPELTFSEFCTNRIVANILASSGNYSDETIEKLNNLLYKELVDASFSKLIRGGKGSGDISAAMIIINKLQEEGLINLYKDGDTGYATVIRDLVSQLRGVNLTEAGKLNNNKVLIRYKKGDKYHEVYVDTDTLYKGSKNILDENGKPIPVYDTEGKTVIIPTMKDIYGNEIDVSGEITEWKMFKTDETGKVVTVKDKYGKDVPVEIEGKLVDDGAQNEVAALNKAIYNYYKDSSEHNLIVLQSSVNKLVNTLFGKGSKFEGYNVKELPRVMGVGDYSSFGVLNLYKSKKELNAARQGVIDEYNKTVDRYNGNIVQTRVLSYIYKHFFGEGHTQNWKDLSPKRRTIVMKWLVDNNINTKQKIKARLDLLSEQNKELKIEIESRRGAANFKGDDVEELKRNPFTYELEDGTKEALGKEIYDDAIINGEEGASKEAEDYVSPEDVKGEGEGELGQRIIEGEDTVAEVENRNIENQGKEAIGIEQYAGRTKNPIEISAWDGVISSMFMSDEFDRRLARQGKLLYNNSFLIDEYGKSTDNYLNTSYNGLLNIASFKSRDQLLNRLRDRDAQVKARIRSLSKKKELSVDEEKELSNLNQLTQYIYNGIITLEGKKATLTPTQIAKINGFDKSLIGKQTYNGKINNISLAISYTTNTGGRKQIFEPSDVFGEQFDMDDFLSSYMDVLLNLSGKEDSKNGTITIMYDVGKENPIYETIKVSELFNTPLGEYILKKYNIPMDKAGKVGDGYNRSLSALTELKNRIGSNLRKYRYEELPDGSIVRRGVGIPDKEAMEYQIRNGVLNIWQAMVEIEEAIVNGKKKTIGSWMDWSPQEWKLVLDNSDRGKYYMFSFLDDAQKEEFKKLVGITNEIEKNMDNKFIDGEYVHTYGRQLIDDYIERNGTEDLENFAKASGYDDFTDMILRRFEKMGWFGGDEIDKKKLRLVKQDVNDLGWSMMRDDGVKSNLNRMTTDGTTIDKLYYKLDTYLNNEELGKGLSWGGYSSINDRIMKLKVIDDNGVEYEVIAYKPQFYQIDNSIEGGIGENVGIVEGRFCTNGDEEWEELKSLSSDLRTSDTKATELEPVKDMDIVTVLVKDNEGNQYVGKVKISNGSTDVITEELTEGMNEIVKVEKKPRIYSLHSLELEETKNSMDAFNSETYILADELIKRLEAKGGDHSATIKILNEIKSDLAKGYDINNATILKKMRQIMEAKDIERGDLRWIRKNKNDLRGKVIGVKEEDNRGIKQLMDDMSNDVGYNNVENKDMSYLGLSAGEVGRGAKVGGKANNYQSLKDAKKTREAQIISQNIKERDDIIKGQVEQEETQSRYPVSNVNGIGVYRAPGAEGDENILSRIRVSETTANQEAVSVQDVFERMKKNGDEFTQENFDNTVKQLEEEKKTAVSSEEQRVQQARSKLNKNGGKENKLEGLEFEEYKDEDAVGGLYKTDWDDTNPNGPGMKPAKKENKELERKKEQTRQSNTSMPPEDTGKKMAKDTEDLTIDTEGLLEKDPFDIKTDKIWSNRWLNFTNYDVYNDSKDLQQIVGSLRIFFTEARCEQLSEAIKKFNNSIEHLGQEDKARVYTLIRNKADELLVREKGGVPFMDVKGLSKETNDALNEILKIYDEGGRDPQRQMLLLSDKDGFETLLKNSIHNHKAAAIEYYKSTPANVRKMLETNIKEQVKDLSEKDLKRVVDDMLGDPLGTGAMYKLTTGLRSLWRFIKYGPVLFPLSGILMLANSTVLGIARYSSEAKGLDNLMNSDAFKLLIGKKGDRIALDGGREGVGLGFGHGLNRLNEIMFNSNSDLGGTWFDKVLDYIINKLPERNGFERGFKQTFAVAMKGGTHSVFDLCAQGSVRTMELAKALQKNLQEIDINTFVRYLQEGAPKGKEKWFEELQNKIMGDMEKGYSRFFTNSNTAFFSRHRFSKWYLFNALQGYVINRTDEIFSSIKNAVNWYGSMKQLSNMYGDKLGKTGVTWDDFTRYLDTDNQELKAFLMNVLLSAKIGFYMDRAVNGGDFDGKAYSDYIIDMSDYLSSVSATFFYGILTAPVEGMLDYADYIDETKDEFNVGHGLTVGALKTFSEIFSKFFREGKVLNALTDGIVSYGKYGDIDFSLEVLYKEFENIANGLGRFQLVEGTNKYGLDNLTDERDLLGQILLNADKTTNAGRISNKMYALQTVDSILNGEDGSYWKDKLLPYIPVIGDLLQNSITGQGYTFTQAKWAELQDIMDNDKVVQQLNNRDLFNMTEDDKYIWRDQGVYTNDAVDRMYKELTAFDYPNKNRINGTDFKTGYEGELEQIKEVVFTDEILQGLGITEEKLAEYLNTEDEVKKQGLLKIIAAAQAAKPGSSKIVISYLSNLYEYELMKQITGKSYPKTQDLTEEQMQYIKRSTLEKYYPYMFLADKTSWYKAITEYVSNKYPLFESLYKDDDLTGYLSTLGYMDMIMYQQAKVGNVNAKFIKNSWTMLSKYFKGEPARMNAIRYVMDSIERSGFSQGKATSAKMGVLAGNMDFYDKIQKSGMMKALYGEDIEQYNQFVWGVLEDINKIGLETAKSQLKDKNYSGYGRRKYNNNYSPMGQNNEPEAQKFVPAAQKYLNGRTPRGGGYSGSRRPSTYEPGETFKWYWKYYEGLIKTYSDRLVKSTGKKYPAETIEGMTFKTGSNNRGRIKGERLAFPEHKHKDYRTNVFSNLPGSHG